MDFKARRLRNYGIRFDSFLFLFYFFFEPEWLKVSSKHRQKCGHRCVRFTGPLSADLSLAEILFLFAKSFQRVSRQPEHRFFDHIKIHFHAAAHTDSAPSVQVCYSLSGARFAGDEINSKVCVLSPWRTIGRKCARRFHLTSYFPAKKSFLAARSWNFTSLS